MKKDIATKYDIKKLVAAFFENLKANKNIGVYFSKTDWDKFLPVAEAFWENVLFYSGNYDGNPMEVHKQVHEKMPFSKLLFLKWLNIFNSTVDDMFEGEKAEQIKRRANSIATVMQVKILSTE